MIKTLFSRLILVLSLFVSACNAAEKPENSQPAKRREPTMLDRWNEVRHQAALAVGAIKPYPAPRRVERSAKPEVIIKGSSIFFDGKRLELGQPLASWKKILKRQPHCDETGIEWCVWEDLGFEVSASKANNFKVTQFVIMLSIPRDRLEKSLVTENPDGTPVKEIQSDWLVRHPFRGYLEIDGYGIDKDTKYWEFESSIDRGRDMHCGLRNCEFPGGVFGLRGVIALHLNSGSESSTIEEITIYTISN